MKYRIDYLDHSGFLLETESCLLIFDYFRDPAGVAAKRLAESDKPAYFFVSHVHGDHFNPAIARFADRAKGYILHTDCRLAVKEEKVHSMDVMDHLVFDELEVRMYGSTDEGGSFLVTLDGGTIFHAGDLNWWHWAGERAEENIAAGKDFKKELARIEETQVDVAFFPVDARLQVAREWGVKAFLGHVDAGLLVPMHANGSPWLPSYEFCYTYPEQKLWIPRKSGESYEGEINDHE